MVKVIGVSNKIKTVKETYNFRIKTDFRTT